MPDINSPLPEAIRKKERRHATGRIAPLAHNTALAYWRDYY
jgi:hypothetical protein